MASNGTTSSSCLDPVAFKITVSVVLTLLILITIAGNVVVCLAVGLNRRLRSLTNCFIMSLAITDLLLGLLVLPFSAFYQLSCRWNFGKVFCNIYTSLDVMLCTASILNLFMISLDRYCAVTDPLRYPVLVTPARVTISLVLIWVISITLSFLSIHLGWNSRNVTSSADHTIPKCKVQVNLVYGLVDGLVTFYLPLLVMCITYYRIFKIAWGQAKRIHNIGSWRAATIREHKATVTLAAVMGAFIICWFPYFTVFVYRGLRGDDAVNETFEAVVLWLGYANSALNPILYAALNRDFRTAYQQLFRCSPASHNIHRTSLRSNSSQLMRNPSREPTWQEERPLRLQVWSGTEVTAPQGATDRKPALSCTVCSSNLLSCCKRLWALRFLQRHVRGPSEEQPGEPLSEESLRTLTQESVRTLPSEAVYTQPQDAENPAPGPQD
ncbi:histamine H2 receptor isoform X2 [Hippopotamus amphibius kiboko]|uniref:histamine H2 receptor isoform X2 n=1 Tax=Hippopotamus amphibius kiboko TaxID=575201 RepID=UPI0025923A0B|nr:histamine H2 receptor isoform X2 [Hippopotamus amphibius kiboko]